MLCTHPSGNQIMQTIKDKEKKTETDMQYIHRREPKTVINDLYSISGNYHWQDEHNNTKASFHGLPDFFFVRKEWQWAAKR